MREDYVYQMGLPEDLKSQATQYDISSGYNNYAWNYHDSVALLDWIKTNIHIPLFINVFNPPGSRDRFQGYFWSYKSDPTKSRVVNIQKNLASARQFIDQSHSELGDGYFYNINFRTNQSLDVIENEFFERAIVRASSLLYNPEDIVEIIKRCQALGLDINGIDAFELTDEYTKNTDYLDTDVFDKYFNQYHVKRESGEGHWEEAIGYINENSSKGWVFSLTYG